MSTCPAEVLRPVRQAVGGGMARLGSAFCVGAQATGSTRAGGSRHGTKISERRRGLLMDPA